MALTSPGYGISKNLFNGHEKAKQKIIFNLWLKPGSNSNIFKWGSEPEKKNTVKFLTQEGKLVEIDVDKLPAAKRTASKADVQNWIKK